MSAHPGCVLVASSSSDVRNDHPCPPRVAQKATNLQIKHVARHRVDNRLVERPLPRTLPMAAVPVHGLFSHPDVARPATRRAFSPAEVARYRTDLFREPTA